MQGMAVRRAIWAGRARSLAFWLLALLVATSIGLLGAVPAYAAAFTVNSTADTGDATPEGVCDSDSTAAIVCTFREAIQEANANNNPTETDTIDFAIPGDGPHFTISPSSQLPTITQPVTIDGYTQGDATVTFIDDAAENTLAQGTNAVLKIVLSGASASPGSSGVSGLWISGGNTTIRGLVINGFRSSPALDRGDGIFLLNVTGNTNNVIEGNFIGTDVNGTADAGNQSVGIAAFGQSTGNTIGGSDAADRNLISGNNRNGVEVQSSGNEIRGNLIGADRTGATDLGNSLSGILVGGNTSGNVVAENQVAFNGFHGVRVQDDTTSGASILSNSVFSNEGLGINLVDSINDPVTGVTPNDSTDADMGPNNLQNFPKIASARTSRRATVIKGSLSSIPNTTFTIQFFSNLEKDSSGFGEGQSFLGERTDVTTNDEGKASFTFKPAEKVKKGSFVTATATDPDGNTSEFSATRKVRRA